MSKRIPAQCFPPGEYISDEIHARGWSVVNLASKMSRGKKVFSEEDVQNIINGTWKITPDIAFALRHAFGTSVELWTNLQSAYDEWAKGFLTPRALDAAPTESAGDNDLESGLRQ